MSNFQNPLSRKRAFDDDDVLEAQNQHGGKKARLDDNNYGMSKDELDEFGLGDDSDDDEDVGSADEDDADEAAKDPAPTSRADSAAGSNAPPPFRAQPMTKEEKAAVRQEAQARMKAKKNAFRGTDSAPKKRKATEGAETDKEPKKRKRIADTPTAEGDDAPKKRAEFKCGTCGELGHIKVNKKKCPALNGTWPNGVKPVETAQVDSEADASGEEDEVYQNATLAPATAVTATPSAADNQAGASDDEDIVFEDVLPPPAIANNAEQAKPDAKAVADEHESDEFDYLFSDSSQGTSKTPPPSATQQIASAPPQHSRKDSGLDAESAAASATTTAEVIDLVSDGEQPVRMKGKRVILNPKWVAKVFVNNVEIGYVEGGKGCEGLQFLKPLPVVKGYITTMNGYVEGDLTIRKSGKNILRVGGCVPTDSAVKRFNERNWGDIDVHNLKIERRTSYKEIRVTVLRGKALVFRDDEQVQESVLESESVKEKINYHVRDGLSIADVKTFEEWQEWSSNQLKLGDHLPAWPAYPAHVKFCTDHGLHCVTDKSVGHGSIIGACAHEIKRFIEISELARTKDLGDLFQAEIDRFAPLRNTLTTATNLERNTWTEQVQKMLNEQKGPALVPKTREAREKEVTEMVNSIAGENDEHVFKVRMREATKAYIERLMLAFEWIVVERKEQRKLGLC